jgi:hypothetical protein
MVVTEKQRGKTTYGSKSGTSLADQQRSFRIFYIKKKEKLLIFSSANCIWILPRKGVLVPRTGALDPGASTTSTSSPETRDEKYWF